ncbi:hypothetical protein SAMN05660909_01625 [Chitinophaga terrae (ex Kim and Jung 2007)]|uniref:Uncharacterized protein n=1 Tax=Chitinophaga terrae (ex Kim and Jung 2007) TaxID=408074 RepID=A0A1H4AKC1_9BACT|nr:hypothetical protein [Chitinophaga terrae (ex Kim and Jung 2007)]GEP89287.1 hypothetical protein CTE07_09320 [Chitinophaga terrae (ex Kim and Jung 2007)]SEA36237.1 hypothetical protein SAMN05660909_01625 [Chitinophaga terrae (ex Kim and Jung 2007)]
MNKCYFLFFCFGVWACNQAPKGKEALVTGDSIIVASNQTDTVTRRSDVTEKQSSVMDCDEVLNRMFQTSNYRPDTNLHLSDYRIHVSEPGDSALGIRIYHTHGNDSTLMGILNFDLETGKLMDLSPSLDSAVELRYDSSWLKIIRKHCGNLPPGLY